MCLSLSYRRFTVRCGYKSDLNDKIQNHGNQCTSKVSQLKEIIHHLLALIFQKVSHQAHNDNIKI